MQSERWAGPLALCARLGLVLGLVAGAAPLASAEPARRVPVAASDAKPPAPPRAAAASASAVSLGDPPGFGSAQCEGLWAEVRQTCIERTVLLVR